MIVDGLTKKHDGIKSFLLIGQSNMAGRGDFGEVEPISNPLCYMLRMGSFQRMTEPINPDREIFGTGFHSGISLAASFADRFAKHFDEKIGLIPCADGGTSVSEWQPGGVLFDHAVLMTRLAMRSSTFGGVLWHQGESDCRDERFPMYKERLIRMIEALRRELDADELPFIFGELSESITPKWKVGDYPKRMNELFREIEGEIPNCRLVSAKDLALKPDGLHFNSSSLRELGNRYFDAYLELVNER